MQKPLQKTENKETNGLTSPDRAHSRGEKERTFSDVPSPFGEEKMMVNETGEAIPLVQVKVAREDELLGTEKVIALVQVKVAHEDDLFGVGKQCKVPRVKRRLLECRKRSLLDLSNRKSYNT
jgi:hypothetical protein